MIEDFKPSLRAVLVHEGGLSDNKADPGGRTNRGVTQKVYNGWRRNQGLETRDVMWIEQAEVEAIYKTNYWDAVKGDDLPTGVSYVVFDGAVNSGSTQSVKWLQRALGVTADGQLGQVTLNALNDVGDHDQLIANICDLRLKFMRQLKPWSVFGGGWSNRVKDVRKRGQAWATGGEVAAPVYFLGGAQKATLQMVKPAPKSYGQSAIGGGVATGGAAGVLQQVQDAISPYADASDAIKKVMVVLIVLGAILTIAGAAYSFWAKRQAAKRADALDLIGAPDVSPA